MKILNFEDFMKKYNLKDDTKDQSEQQRICNYPIYQRGSKIHSDKVFNNIDNGSMGGSHWICFYKKDRKSFYFDSFQGQPDKFLLNQLHKSIIYHKYKLQDNNSKSCGSYCLYFFFLFERLDYYDIILKLVFE